MTIPLRGIERKFKSEQGKKRRVWDEGKVPENWVFFIEIEIEKEKQKWNNSEIGSTSCIAIGAIATASSRSAGLKER